MSEARSRLRGDPVKLSELGKGVRAFAQKNPATQRLLDEGEAFAGAKMQQLMGSLGNRIGETTRKLTDVADGNSNPGSMLGKIVKESAGGASPVSAVAKAGVKGLADKAKSAFKGGGKSSGGKSMNIIEDLDVGVPIRVAYNHWTRYDQFSKWSKGTQSVDVEDPTKSSWKAKIAWSNRSWKATVTEQVPDQKIAWKTEGQTAVNGVITFHPLEDDLTRLVVVLEYIPHGFFEKTANLWRAPGRRARLDLKLFRRYVMLHADPDEADEGWRGEIRDGEIVREHDEVVAEEKDESDGKRRAPAEDEDDEDFYDDEDFADEEPEEPEEEEEEPERVRAEKDRDEENATKKTKGTRKTTRRVRSGLGASRLANAARPRTGAPSARNAHVGESAPSAGWITPRG